MSMAPKVLQRSRGQRRHERGVGHEAIRIGARNRASLAQTLGATATAAAPLVTRFIESDTLQHGNAQTDTPENYG
jgi:hypothetical protein